MAAYPELPSLIRMTTPELQNLYDEVQRWSAELALELDARDQEIRYEGVTKVVTFVTTTDYEGRPIGGTIMYSTSLGQYFGWDALTSTWDAMT